MVDGSPSPGGGALLPGAVGRTWLIAVVSVGALSISLMSPPRVRDLEPPAATAQPIAVQLRPAEARLAELLEEARLAVGLPALDLRADLTEKARAWAAAMADSGLRHSSLADGVTACWALLGENIGLGSSVERIHAAFLASPAHYANLVQPRFDAVGVGVATGSDGDISVAQVFMATDADC